MVITTPHVVRSFLHVKEDTIRPYQKLVNSAKSSISVQLYFKGCTVVKGPELHLTDIECYLNRILIGRVHACDLCIPDDPRISRYHSTIECSRDGQWIYRDLGSKSGSALKPNPASNPVYGPKPLPKILNKNVPYRFQNHDIITIGRVHQGHAHEIALTIHYPGEDDRHSGSSGAHGGCGMPDSNVPRRLTWRRSLHCNACMGWSRRHSCSARFSQLQKMILDCNKKSNTTAPRPIKTAIQKVLFHRVSGWWPKKPDPRITFQVPERYEKDPLRNIGMLPDDLARDSSPALDGDAEIYVKSAVRPGFATEFQDLDHASETESDEEDDG